jgi:hypothetical protein
MPFTCFTGAKVQSLTLDASRARAGGDSAPYYKLLVYEALSY